MDPRSEAEAREYILTKVRNPGMAASRIAADVDLRLGVWLAAVAASTGIKKMKPAHRPVAELAIAAALRWAVSADNRGETDASQNALDEARAAYEDILDLTDLPYDQAPSDIHALEAAQYAVNAAIVSHEVMYGAMSRRRSLQSILEEARRRDPEYRSPMDLVYDSVDSLVDAGVSETAILKAMVDSLRSYPHDISRRGEALR